MGVGEVALGKTKQVWIVAPSGCTSSEVVTGNWKGWWWFGGKKETKWKGHFESFRNLQLTQHAGAGMCHQCVQTVLHMALDVTLRTLRVHLASLEFMKGISYSGLDRWMHGKHVSATLAGVRHHIVAMRERGREWRDPP